MTFYGPSKLQFGRARATAMTFYGPQSCSLPACKGSKLPKFQTPSPTCTLGPRPLPQQAPQGQATAMAFYGLSKLAFLGFQSCRLPARKPSKTLQALLQTLQTLQNPPNPPNTVPSRHLRSTAMTFYGPQSCRLPACKGSKLPKFQTPSPTCTLGPRQLPQQAPQGQATAMAFLGFQSCRLPARKPSKTLQTPLQTLQNPPNPPNTVPSRHLRSTAMTFYGPQSCRLPACKGSKLPNTFPNMHPRAKATSPTGTPGPGHSNGFLRLSKLPFASPQTLQNSPKLSKPSKPSKRSKPS